MKILIIYVFCVVGVSQTFEHVTNTKTFSIRVDRIPKKIYKNLYLRFRSVQFSFWRACAIFAGLDCESFNFARYKSNISCTTSGKVLNKFFSEDKLRKLFVSCQKIFFLPLSVKRKHETSTRKERRGTWDQMRSNKTKHLAQEKSPEALLASFRDVVDSWKFFATGNWQLNASSTSLKP